MMTSPIPYRDLAWPERLKIRQICEDSGSQFAHIVGDGFQVAIGRGKFGDTCRAMEDAGYKCVDLYTFPLGSDKPADHLRHDHSGMPSCCWLFATFSPIG